MKYWRMMRALVVGYFALIALGLVVGTFVSGNPAMLIGVAFVAAIGAFAAFMFKRAMDAFSAALARARAALETVVAQGMDGPGASVQEKWDASVAQTYLGSRKTISRMNTGTGLTVEGLYAGAQWQYASYVLPSRNPPMYYVSSYVRVEIEGANIPFKIARQGLGGRVAAALGAPTDVQVGDEAFDKAFALTGDAEVLREVLDPQTRRDLMTLMEQSSGPFWSMDLEVVGGSLVLHWPGEMTGPFALALRDFLARVRARLLEVLARRAVSGVRVGGFRTTGDATEESEVERSSATARGSSQA